MTELSLLVDRRHRLASFRDYNMAKRDKGQLLSQITQSSPIAKSIVNARKIAVK
jgi:hypothetical protein